MEGLPANDPELKVEAPTVRTHHYPHAVAILINTATGAGTYAVLPQSATLFIDLLLLKIPNGRIISREDR